MTAPATYAFVMHGAREAMTAGLSHIEEHVKGVEQAVSANPGLAFDLAKTLIESTCRVILRERSVAFAETDDLPKLFKTATQNLPLLPATASAATEVRKSLAQTLSGLGTAVQGICELRNQCGFASHGSGAARPVMESVQALLAAETADAIVGFLHRMHRQDRTPPAPPAPSFEDSDDFNLALDEEVGPIQIREIEFRASEVLFQMEPETYRIYLAEFEDNGADATAPDAEETQS